MSSRNASDELRAHEVAPGRCITCLCQPQPGPIDPHSAIADSQHRLIQPKSEAPQRLPYGPLLAIGQRVTERPRKTSALLERLLIDLVLVWCCNSNWGHGPVLAARGQPGIQQLD